MSDEELNMDEVDMDLVLDVVAFVKEEEYKSEGGPWERITGYEIRKVDLGLSIEYLKLMLTRGFFNRVFEEYLEIYNNIDKKYCK